MTRNRFVRGAAAAAALALLVAACGDDDDDTGAATAEETATAEAPATTAATADESAEAPATTAATAEDSATAEAPATTAATADESAAEPSGDLLGEPNPATGSELKLMYMWSGVSPAVDNSSDLASMKAVVQWINEYGGGIGSDHRKLVMDDCPTNSDNAVAAACGSTIVDGGYSLVVFNVVGEIEPWATP